MRHTLFQIATATCLLFAFQNCSKFSSQSGTVGALVGTPNTIHYSSQSVAASEVYDIIVIAGQSNAEGAGAGAFTDDHSQDGRIFQLGRYNEDNLKVLPATDALQNWHYYPGVPSAGFATSFAREYVKSKPGRKVLIVPAAKGSTSILEWENSGELYADMKMRVKHALSLNRENRVVAFLWHQGETDVDFIDRNNPAMPNAAVYGTRLQTLINSVRTDFAGGATPFPFLAGDFVPSWYADHQSKFDVRETTRSVLGRNTQAYYVSSYGLLSNYEANTSNEVIQSIHFSAQAGIDFGKRYFTVFNQKQSGPQGLLDEDLEQRINALYVAVLGREADSGGLHYSVIALHRHLTISELRGQMARSEEAKARINELYQKQARRLPTASELQQSQDLLASTWSLQNLKDYLAENPPPTKDVQITAFLTHLYLSALNRQPDQGGLAFWIEQYNAGRETCISLTRAVMTSPENVLRVQAINGGRAAQTTYVTRLYETSFWRAPDTGGLNFWVDELSRGFSVSDLDQTFLGSEEFKSVCASKGIRN
ncbi:MAG: DUF4214 domain-containing protein [Bdellovibrionales bacterium]|nr:DUF4214 domain-containing protein [Bdellovibrionales bacterium]